MKRITLFHTAVALFAFAGLVTAGHAQDKKPKKADPRKVEGAESMARIDAIESWSDLFNGKDLTGWIGDTKMYVVEDGVLVCQKGAKNLISEKEYSDFVLQFEFKLNESGNNGIGIRVPKDGHAASGGMEIQVLDHRGTKYNHKTDEGKTLTWLKPWQVHGSIYGIMPAATGYLKPLDQWNQQTIICIEDHIKVILNGAVIVDVFLEDVTPVDGKPHPGMLNKSGHITLAGHSDRMEFKNLKVAEYTPSPTKAASDADNTPPAGFKAMFNGKDLTGWKGLAHKNANERMALKGAALAEAQKTADKNMNEHWSVVEGILTYDGKGMSLCTDKDYGDFEFYCDWKIPPGADSGIYLRDTPQVQIWDPWDPRTKDKSIPATPEDWVTAYKNGRNLGSGGLWNNKRTRNAPLVLADKKPGEWNTFLIRMVGNKVTIWLNDKLIVNRTELENYWDKTGTVPLPRADQIELQHHGSELFFKNMYIRDLPY